MRPIHVKFSQYTNRPATWVAVGTHRRVYDSITSESESLTIRSDPVQYK